MKDITFGAEEITKESDYFVFSRFSPKEKSVSTDSPDSFKRTDATSGVRFDFYSDAEKISFDYKMIRASSRTMAFFDVYIDGIFSENIGKKDADIELADSYEMLLPVGEKRITIYLSNLYAMQIKNFVLHNCSFIKPYQYKCCILSYGDSITQGYDSLFPSFSYINQLAIKMDAFLYNKGIGGDVFRPKLVETKEYIPDIVTIAYGTNDWRKFSKEEFINNMAGFIKNIVETYCESQIIVITPIWRKDFERQVKFGTFEQMVNCIIDECKKYNDIKIIKGDTLLPHTDLLFADGRVHPNDIGMSIYSDNLYKKLKSEFSL